jgi:hypothetical protein
METQGRAREDQMEKTEARRLRADLTPAERKRFEKYRSIDFQSAGATRKRGGSSDRERTALQLSSRLRKLHGVG